jgi:iron(III) transport system ATP-binding protein
MSELVLCNVVKTHGGREPVHAVRGVDLQVPAGSLTAVLGPSGCGKTTLLRVVAGLETIDEGTIDIGGQQVAAPGVHVAPERRRVGIVPQEGALFPHLRVGANIAFGLRGWSRADVRDRVTELLDLVNLSGFGDRQPGQLSGGQQQRVALARALAPRPQVVLLDEPFSALDTSLRTSVRDEVAAVLRSTGTTAVLVTHDQAEALTVADQVAVMRDGIIVQVAPPGTLYHHPVDAWTAAFVGDAVTMTGRTVECSNGGHGDGHSSRRASHVHTRLGLVPLAPGSNVGVDDDVVVHLRPEQIVPSESDGASCPAVVTKVRFGGPDVEVTLQVDDVSLTARWPSTATASIGDRVGLAVVGSALLVTPAAVEIPTSR